MAGAGGDDMHYSLFAGDRDRFTVSRDSGTVSYIGQGEDFELGPSRFELQVTANDGQYQTRGRVVVRVVDVAEGPEAGDDEAETPEDTPTVIDVLSNDRDPDGDQLRIASVGAAEHGTTAVVSDGIQYAPELNWHGTDRFTYTVSDESGVTATATVTVPGRQSVAQHLAHRLPGQPEAARRRPLAQPLHIDAAPHLRIELHSIHPSCVPQHTLGMLGGPLERSGFLPPSGASNRRAVVYSCSAVLRFLSNTSVSAEVFFSQAPLSIRQIGTTCRSYQTAPGFPGVGLRAQTLVFIVPAQ